MIRKFHFVIAFLLLSLAGIAQQYPERPNPPRLVNDFTGTLQPEEVSRLEDKLLAYNDSTSTQIAIVMISSLDGYPVDDYAITLAERWGIGQKAKDNGVLIFIAKDDRKIFIPTGYGMEGVMPDALVKRIIENDIKPYFKQGQYYEGLDKGTDSMFQLAAGEYQAEPRKQEKPPMLLIAAIIMFVILMIFSRINSVRSYSSLNGISFWAAWELLNQARRSHHGTWGGFSGRGGGSWGGGGGGGFGGFGGGSFGGGGAGGSW
jgi:uncharacterized protein